MKNDDRDELDEIIDGALAGYSSADPMEGLEDRVLRRVHAAGAARRGPWRLRLWFALPALAALLLAGITLRIEWKPQSRTTKPTPTVAGFKPPSLPPPRPQLRPAPPLRVAKPHHRIRTLPKQEYFPAPAPITNEERALVAWVGRAPIEAQQAFADLQKRSDEPVDIQPIQIPPLRTDGAK
jgi:hypothetical protein